MTNPYILSATQISDTPAIEALLDQSFGLERRTKTSYRLREGSTAAEGLSFVVRDDEVGISGSISYWPMRIGLEGTPALMLGPLAVHSDRQNRGIGLVLMQQTLAHAKSLGHKLVLLVGDEPYYARVGFQRVPHDKILLPGPLNRARFLFLELQNDALVGVQGLALPPWRFDEISATFAEPHRTGHQEQTGQRQ